ncbi:hypothetical protein Tsubulata_035393 [Turnera subulata]|uniref:TIR domain-containing protein n=1 Tax=Turnera subulata TaxID=218843 RepID=A0A9Q0J0N7_9ROSI|nr:hypothetical protein Tsubulata_035393 [Turnera subulata]
MAASSSSSAWAVPRWKYDVFLSFRGKDTRYNIVSHLYDALSRLKLKTFMDDNIDRGEEISPSLLRTIEESGVSVVIFSENYASSRWCVEELVKILDCKAKYAQIVLPIFYHVDPSDIKQLKGSFGKAFAPLANSAKGEMDLVERWRDALSSAAVISGWDSKVVRDESRLVHEVVQHILNKLNYISSSGSKGLVGIDSRVEHFKQLLERESPAVRSIGIWGMGGIGKTTTSGAVFNCVSGQYEASCFLPNVREESLKSGGLHLLRKELFSSLLPQRDHHTGAPYIASNLIKKQLNRMKVLVVLDDIDDVEQFEFLCGGGHHLFGAGSRIILTSRDKQVLMNVVNDIYEVKELNHLEALQLFSMTAFKENHPPEDYRELSVRAIKYTEANPLALKVLGSFLYRRNKQIWEATMNEIGRILGPKVHCVLRTSFDALDDDQKNIFLDIACFFKGRQVKFVRDLLGACGFAIETGFCVLTDRCLIGVSNDKIQMHDLIQDMAHKIVEEESPKKIGKRSRLWKPWDVYEVLVKNLGTERIEGIFLDVSQVREMNLSSRAFARMHKLKLLKIYNSGNRLQLPRGLKYLSDELRYLDWDDYPLNSLPPKFLPENLVVLNLSSSKVEQLWNGDQNLMHLKELNLSCCERLIELPLLSRAINLETLNLRGCSRLQVVPQITSKWLTDLDMQQCTSLLVNLSDDIYSLKCLVISDLSGCSSLTRLPDISGRMKYLYLSGSGIEELPSSIGCSSISEFPEIPENIKALYLNGTAVERIPSSIGHCSCLYDLDLENCKRFHDLPASISGLKSLHRVNLSGCSSLRKSPLANCNVEICMESVSYFDHLKLLEIGGDIKWSVETSW